MAETSAGPSRANARRTLVAARPRTFRRGAAQRTRLLFIAPVAIYLAFVFVFPIGFNIWLSFQDFGLKSLITGVSQFVGLNNFATALADPDFQHAAINSLIFTLVSMVAQYVLGFGLALFFYKTFPLGRTIRALLILPWLIPSIVATTAWRFMLREPSGFLNQALHLAGISPVQWLTSPDFALTSVILINIWIGIAFNLVILHSGMQSIPTERFEAAELDGARYWQRVRYIILPALKPVTAIILTLGFVYTLKQFDLVWALTGGGPGNASQLLSTWSYTLTFSKNQYGMGAAVADFLFAASAIVISIYSIAQGRRSRA